MIKIKLLISLAILIATLISCATIQSYRNLEQPVSKTLNTSIGGTIFRLNRSADLPNVFGKADLYGGKVDKGYAELKFLGFSDKGELVLSIQDINKSSTETTMDRYKENQIKVETNVDVLTSEGKNETKFTLDTEKQSEIIIAGIKVIFTKIQPYSVSYVLEDTYK